MPLPFIIGAAAAAAAATGITTGVRGAVKMKNAQETMKEASKRHEQNMARYKSQSADTTTVMDKLGEKELGILKSFSEFSDLFEKIHNRPEFKAYSTENVTIPAYSTEELRKVSVGAGVLMGGLGGAALGTAGGFAAAGATTAAVMALGTASTGAAISGLTGVAATNATLAALGGGAIAAGGGGIALGTTILGAATAGIGLMVGGIVFNITGASLSKKADEAWDQMVEAAKQINKVCTYLNVLKNTADKYYSSIDRVDAVYRRHLSALDAIININGKTEWSLFTDREKIVTENAVLLVQLLYKMCQVKLVLVSEKKDETNKVNSSEVDEMVKTAENFMRERGINQFTK